MFKDDTAIFNDDEADELAQNKEPVPKEAFRDVAGNETPDQKDGEEGEILDIKDFLN